MLKVFGIQNNRTTELTETIFQPCEDYVLNWIEDLYQKTREVKHSPDDCSHLSIFGTCYARRVDKCIGINPKHPIMFIDDSLANDAYEFKEFIDKVKQDVRFIQMWLSLVVVPMNSTETARRIPPILLKVSPYSLYDVEYKIPEGKESVWHKAEDIIKYYLGLRLVL